MKKWIALLLCLGLCAGLTACNRNDNDGITKATNETTEEMTEALETNELVILYTNDVHNAYQSDPDSGRLGYAALAAYRDALEEEGKTVLLIDGGDSIQGEAVGMLTKGSYIVDIMNEVSYDLAAPGNHEFDFGMETFLDLAQNRAEYSYISCNFTDLRTGETVFEPYRILEFGGVKVAFVGITTPETFTSSTPAYFQDDSGNYIYGLAEGNNGADLYECVQNAIDAAKNEGADYVIGVGHTGVDPASSPWTTTEIIANTTGMIAYLDGHSHTPLAGEILKDMDGKEVAVSSSNNKMTTFADVRIDLNSGSVSASLVEGLTEESSKVKTFTDDIASQFADLLEEVVARNETKLIIYEPDDPDTRIIRSQETNLGDLCADAYRVLLGADIGIVNGGGIRAQIGEGPVTYGDVIAVHPYGNMACLVEATGQEILDALELSYSQAGAAEFGGFLQVSGLTCEVNTAIASPVKTDDQGAFQSIEGERRVSNVKIGGVDIDPAKTYTVASHNYLLKSGGDGYTMFRDNVILKDELMMDSEVLIRYIEEHLNGVIPKTQYGEPYGEGRITIN